MKIFTYIGKREWGLAVIALCAIVTQVYLDLKLPDYMQDITILIVTPNSEMSDVLQQGGYMLLCALGSMCAAIVTGFCTAMIGATLAKNLRGAVFDQTMDFSMAESNRFSLSSLITRSTNDVTQIQMFVVMGLQMAIKSPILAVWAMTKIADKNTTWTIATAITVVIVMLFLVVIMSLVMPKMMRMQRITDDLNRVTREHLDGLRVIRAYSAQGFHAKRFEHTNDELTGTSMYVNADDGVPHASAHLDHVRIDYCDLRTGCAHDQRCRCSRRTHAAVLTMIVFSSYAMQVIGAFMMLAVVFIFFPRARVFTVVLAKCCVQTSPSKMGRSRSLASVSWSSSVTSISVIQMPTTTPSTTYRSLHILVRRSRLLVQLDRESLGSSTSSRASSMFAEERDLGRWC